MPTGNIVYSEVFLLYRGVGIVIRRRNGQSEAGIAAGTFISPAKRPEGSFLLVKRSGQEVDSSPPSSAHVTNKWSYTSTSLIRLHDVETGNFTFLQLKVNYYYNKSLHLTLSRATSRYVTNTFTEPVLMHFNRITTRRSEIPLQNLKCSFLQWW
jgi:hypothetical protein